MTGYRQRTAQILLPVLIARRITHILRHQSLHFTIDIFINDYISKHQNFQIFDIFCKIPDIFHGILLFKFLRKFFDIRRQRRKSLINQSGRTEYLPGRISYISAMISYQVNFPLNLPGNVIFRSGIFLTLYIQIRLQYLNNIIHRISFGQHNIVDTCYG